MTGIATLFAMGAAHSPPSNAQTAGGTQAPTAKPSEGAPVAAISPYIDVHTHLERAVAKDSIEVAVRAMQAENSAKYLFLAFALWRGKPALI